MNMFELDNKLKLICIHKDGDYDSLHHGEYNGRQNEIRIDYNPDFHEEFLRLYAIDHFHEDIIYKNSIELFSYFNKKDIMLFHDNTNYREKDERRHGLIIIPANVSIEQLSFLLYTEPYMKDTYEKINIIDMKWMGTKQHPIVTYEELIAYIRSICPDPITGEITPIEQPIQR